MNTPKINLDDLKVENFVVVEGDEMTYVSGGSFTSWTSDSDSGSACSFSHDTDR